MLSETMKFNTQISPRNTIIAFITVLLLNAASCLWLTTWGVQDAVFHFGFPFTFFYIGHGYAWICELHIFYFLLNIAILHPIFYTLLYLIFPPKHTPKHTHSKPPINNSIE
ncbi:hypothetical protein JD969_14255 [Planctomycetota bacterium]|nr:hypothetical protein JD969_14255 [Planctomycetota bacterium]